jgi:hypothetical protein
VQIFIPDQFRDEGLTHRRVERRRKAKQQGEEVDVPEPDDARDGVHPQHQGETAHRRLRDDQELTLVAMVGGEARPGQQQERRPELQRQ